MPVIPTKIIATARDNYVEFRKGEFKCLMIVSNRKINQIKSTRTIRLGLSMS